MGRLREASRLGENCEAGRIYSNEKAERSKQVGGDVLKTGRLLQVEKKESKRVGAEVCKTGRLLQEKKRERKTWLKQGKSICIIGMLSKK